MDTSPPRDCQLWSNPILSPQTVRASIHQHWIGHLWATQNSNEITWKAIWTNIHLCYHSSAYPTRSPNCEMSCYEYPSLGVLQTEHAQHRYQASSCHLASYYLIKLTSQWPLIQTHALHHSRVGDDAAYKCQPHEETDITTQVRFGATFNVCSSPSRMAIAHQSTSWTFI